MLRELASGLHADLRSGKAVPALAAGFTSGLGLLVAQVAFGSFIFSGPLASYSSQGVGLVLFGNFAACLVVALGGGYRGAIAGLSPGAGDRDGHHRLLDGRGGPPAVRHHGGRADAERRGHGSVLSPDRALPARQRGALHPLPGGRRVRGRNRRRRVPGGPVADGGGPDWRALPALLEPSVLWKWSPGAAFGIALYLALKRWRHPLILPLSVALAVGAYHLALSLLGISGEAARAAGLLLSSTADGGLWPALLPADLVHVAWRALAGQGPHMITLILVAFICVVLNVAGLELAANQELDWDREFRVTGVASMLAGVGGGTVATIVVPASLRSKLFGGRHAPYRGGRRPGDRRRAVPGRRHAGAGPGVPGRGNAGLCRTRHAGRGAGQEPPAAPLVGVRHHRVDLRDHHLVGTAGGRGRRDARDPGVLRRAAWPRGPGRGALHRA